MAAPAERQQPSLLASVEENINSSDAAAHTAVHHTAVSFERASAEGPALFSSSQPWFSSGTQDGVEQNEGWWPQLRRQLVETANPRTMHTEDLTPAARQQQAGFESFDYYKSYPAMYLAYLRNKKKVKRRAQGGLGEHHDCEEEDEVEEEEHEEEEEEDEMGMASDSPLHPSPAVAQQQQGSTTSSAAFRAMTRLGARLPADGEERHMLMRWFLHVLIALSVGVVATFVSYAVEIIENYRAEMLSRVICGAPLRVLGYLMGFAVWLLMCVSLVVIATGVVVYIEPAAAGGGIPDVMAYLNGVHMRKAMNFKTFVAKAISCVCAVAGGLPVGLEAPLIHLGAITGAGVTQGRSRTLGFQTPFFKAFRNNKDRRDFITAGAACGVSAAFGAPIGGLLFVMEEVSSFWDHSSSGQIFLATMICFTVATIINSLVEDNRLLGWVSNTASVLFEVNLTIPLNLISIVPSLILGAILGGLAALFTKLNLIMIKWRRHVLRPYPHRRFLEPIVVVAVYSTVMYVLTLLSDCRSLKDISDVNETIHVWGTEGADRLFTDTCATPGEYSPLGTLNMATGKNTIRHLFTRQTVGEFPVYYLLLHFLLYFVFACVSSGMALSGGLVVPSLVIGAIFGRLFGLFLWYVGAHKDLEGLGRSYSVTDAWMDPGVFALIGAGAFLAGTSRMAMSICVIMVELSSELHYLLPVMVAIVMAKAVADWLCEPLYHQILHFDCVPYLSATLPLPDLEQLTAADVMASPVVVLRRRERTEVVLKALRDTTHHAFPVVVEVGNSQADDSSRPRPHASPSRTQSNNKSTSFSEAARSPMHIRGLDSTGIHAHRKGHPSSLTPSSVSLAPNTHMKFVGLVTREDLQVYFTLPQLKHYEPSVENSIVAASAGPVPAAHDDDFGGRLAQCVVNINRMTWPEWVLHKSSLFLSTNDRYDWIRSHVPNARLNEHTGEVNYDSSPQDEGGNDGGSAHASSQAPLLPPVLDLTVIINRSPWVITPAFNLQMAYHTFRTMGLRHMVVVDGDVVKGIITRKDLLVDSLRTRMRALRARLGSREQQHQRERQQRPINVGGSREGPFAAAATSSHAVDDASESPSHPHPEDQRRRNVAAACVSEDERGEKGHGKQQQAPARVQSSGGVDRFVDLFATGDSNDDSNDRSDGTAGPAGPGRARRQDTAPRRNQSPTADAAAATPTPLLWENATESRSL